MELARKTQTESLKFFKGKPIDCDECPIRGKHDFCHVIDDMADCFDREAAEFACYGAFISFLLSEE
jgi:hypothetical protein